MGHLLGVAVAVVDSEGVLRSANPAFARLYGVHLDDVLDRPADDLARTLTGADGDGHADALFPLAGAAQTGARVLGPSQCRLDVDGSTRHVRVSAAPADDATGATVFTVVDLTTEVVDGGDGDHDHRRHRELATIVEQTHDFIAIVDLAPFELVYANRACRHRFGIGEDALPTDAARFFLPSSLDLIGDELWPELRREGRWAGRLTCVTASGEQLEIAWTVNTVLDGSDHRLVAVGRDVTVQTRLAAELSHRASHDPLTGIANRPHFLELAASALRGGDRSTALLFLDLDGFKAVNDELGHDAGDAVLQEVAVRLKEAVRPPDVVGRLGGDEFVVLCPGVGSPGEAVAVARRVRIALADRPFEVAGTVQPLTASVGVAVTDGSAHVDNLLREADAAMYRAKENGRDGIEVYDAAVAARRSARRELASDLRRAVEQRDLTVAYQPIVELATGTVVAVEALARWRHPSIGEVAALRFVRLAEQHGIIDALGAFVVDAAVREAATWPGAPAPALSVNVSAQEIGPGFTGRLGDLLDGTGLVPERLWLEVTESAIVADTGRAVRELRTLRERGVRLAIDDFGTGYSSLSQLRRLPVDLIKIDESFVRGLPGDGGDEAVVTAIVSLARALHLDVVAEGIETADQRHRAALLGCRLAQGFHLGHPLQADGIRRRLTQASMEP